MVIEYKIFHFNLYAWIQSRNESFGLMEYDEVYKMY